MNSDSRIYDTAPNSSPLEKPELLRSLLAQPIPYRLTSSQDQPVLSWYSAELIKVVFHHVAQA